MKKEVAEFVAKCLTCQQIKTEYQAPTGKLNLYLYFNRNRKESLWILLWDYHAHLESMMLFG